LEHTSLIEINNRRDFAEAFNDAMAGAAQSMRSMWQLGKDQNLPKSYLVEFHPKHENTACTWSTEKLFTTLLNVSDSLGISVRVTDDDSLFYLSHSDNSHSTEFIIDALNPRFLAFHTLSNAKETDRFILERLIHQSNEFDSFWLPVTLLEAIEQREKVTGWEATFEPLLDDLQISNQTEDEESVDGIEEEFPEEMVELDQDVPVSIPTHTSLRINILKQNAMATYYGLQKTGILPDIPLSSILAERFDPDLSTAARARIKWNGKITGRGTDFSSYLQIVNGTIDNYAGTVYSLESRYWLALDPISTEYSSGFKFKGEPFSIEFSSEINVESVLSGMFNCRAPFRLMGEPEKVSEGYYVIDAIDLHVDQPMSIELTSTFMRLYLYQGTCGNTIVRILRSLQHFIDANLIHSKLD
jgi:hypothetical protein